MQKKKKNERVVNWRAANFCPSLNLESTSHTLCFCHIRTRCPSCTTLNSRKETPRKKKPPVFECLTSCCVRVHPPFLFFSLVFLRGPDWFLQLHILGPPFFFPLQLRASSSPTIRISL
jgi:hypothetical protein